MSDDFRSKPEWKFGHTVEQRIADVLRGDGHWVIPSYDYTGEEDKAPRMHGPSGWGLVLPDLDVARDGRSRWVEVKAKSEPTLHRITGRLEHGIQRRHATHYQSIEEITGREVWLCIYEESSGWVLLQQLSTLMTEPTMRVYEGGKMGRGGMVFFLRSAFVEWRQLQPLAVTA